MVNKFFFITLVSVPTYTVVFWLVYYHLIYIIILYICVLGCYV